MEALLFGCFFLLLAVLVALIGKRRARERQERAEIQAKRKEILAKLNILEAKLKRRG